jgi:hypothetical protein
LVGLQPDSIVGAASVGDGTPEGVKTLLGDGSGAGVVEVGAEGLAGLLAAESAVGGASVLGVGPDAVVSICDKGGIAAVLLGVDGEFARKDVVVGPEARGGGDDRVTVVDKGVFGDEQADVGVESTGLDATTVGRCNKQTHKHKQSLHHFSSLKKKVQHNKVRKRITLLFFI